MLTYFQGIILGAVQGVSELFPISSLGHSVILPTLLGWSVNQQNPFFLMFLVATHFATALVLFFFFWQDWRRIVAGLGRSLRDREIKASDTDAKLGWLLVVGTIPAGIIGLLFQDQIRTYFLSAFSAACFLILNGVLLAGAEMLRRRAVRRRALAPSSSLPLPSVDSDIRIAQLSWWQGIKVGVLQVLALFPGFSRTGSTIAGSLLAGLSHEDALRFSFLLSMPVIGAAAALELPQLFASGNAQVIHVALVGALAAALFAYLAVRFLTRYFKFENHTLTPFAVYCVLAGIAVLVFLAR